MNGARDSAALAGRVLIAVLFIISGYGKIGGFDGTVQALAGKGLPLPMVVAAITVAIELGGGLLLAVGWKARWAAVAIALFTVLATFFFHDFWNMVDAARRTNQIMFLKNLAIIGGSLMVAAFGPGRYSIDEAQHTDAIRDFANPARSSLGRR